MTAEQKAFKCHFLIFMPFDYDVGRVKRYKHIHINISKVKNLKEMKIIAAKKILFSFMRYYVI